MSGQSQQMSLDDMAAQMAESFLSPGGQLMKGGAAGEMPTGRSGSAGAEGGFTPTAGGRVIDADAAKGMGAPDGEELNKMMGSGGLDKAQPRTGTQVTSEPSRQGSQPLTGDNVTNEPDRQDGGGAGEPAQGQSQSADGFRARKAGKVGGMGDGGADSGKNLSEEEDEATRKRKEGKVGIAKGGVADEEEEEEGGEEELGKGGINADQLMKSLETLEAIAQGSSIAAPADRREELGTKLADGTLSKSEMLELSDLMKSSQGFAADEDEGELNKAWGEAGEEDTVSKSYQETFSADPELSEGYEVSSFLERHSQMTAAALDQVQGTLAKSLEVHRDRSQAFNTQLAKSLRGMAELAQRQDSLIKSMATRLEQVENTPLPRKGVSVHTQVLNKSMGASEVGGEANSLSKSECGDVLESMAMRGIQNTPSGHRVDYAMAMLEQGGQIAKSLYNDILAFRQENNGSVNVR